MEGWRGGEIRKLEESVYLGTISGRVGRSDGAKGAGSRNGGVTRT